MNNTLLRQWAMLRMIPRHPRRIDAPTIHGRLAAQGMQVSLRTVQRDLASLATAFPLECDDAKPQGWWWRIGAGQMDVPGMDPHAALTFNLVEQYMKNLLPPTTLSHLAPWFEAARGVNQSAASSITRWQGKLRVIPHTLNNVPARINPEIQSTVYDGLLHGRQLQITYRAISTGKDAKNYPVHPLGLVIKEQVVYLVCTARDYPDPRFLALHRIETARLLEKEARVPDGFDVDAFIAREFGIRVSLKPLDLVMKVRGVLGKYLGETPAAMGQKMVPLDNQWTRIEAKVPDTVQLRVWLRSLGRDAVVEQPPALRDEIRSEMEELLGLYQHLP